MTVEPLGVTSPSMSPGQLVGGRFRVDSVATEDALGTVLAAVDQKTQKPVALRVLKPELFATQDAVNALRQEARQAASLSHRCLVATYGVGSAGAGSQYVACEWAAGATLKELVGKHRERREPMTLRGIYHVLAQVCAALDASHRVLAHGAVRPSVVWVDPRGNTKLGDLGVAKAVLASRGAAAFGASEQAYLAPEVKAGGTPTVASDVFGLGALLYEMLTMRSPAEGFTPPSQAHPEANDAIDRHLLRALAADPATRFATTREMVEGLAPLVAHGRESSPQMDFELVAAMRPSAPQPVAAPVQPRREPSANEAPSVGMRVSVHEGFRESAVSEPSQPIAAPVDLKSLLAKITENDAPRWMVVKDKLDHGPFSGRELVELILKGEVREDHGLLNMDTGERREVKSFTEFKEFLEQFKLQAKQKAERAAVKRSEKVETASNTVKIVIGIGVVSVIAVLATFLLVTLQATDDTPEETTLNARADLYERGDIQIEGTVGILPIKRGRGGGGGGGGGAPRAGGGGGNLSYEEAMNRAADLGDATQGGGERQLTSGDVAGVMNRHINSFFGCVGQELRRGSNLSNVEIDLAIAGSGQVLGASTRQGSPAFKSCIAGRVRSIRFPSFPAPRMGARFRFSVN